MERRQKSPSGAGASFLAPWQFGASLRETNGVQRSRCCQSVMTGCLPPGCPARDGQRLSCPIRKDGQQATPTARTPPVGKNVKRWRWVVDSALGGWPCFATGVHVTLNTAIHKRQTNYVPDCQQAPTLCFMFTNQNQSHLYWYCWTQKIGCNNFNS